MGVRSNISKSICEANTIIVHCALSIVHLLGRAINWNLNNTQNRNGGGRSFWDSVEGEALQLHCVLGIDLQEQDAVFLTSG